MSVNLSIKSVPDEWAERLRLRAERNHRSLQGELMALVERAVLEAGHEAPPARAEAAAAAAQGGLGIEDISRRVSARYAALPARPADIPSGADIVRQMRDSRHGR
ncbi:MAG: Arc family DNA-binding protein [Roseateles sp.]|uniref:FitA-like ribbon-helix-helix domain-containing protein n=1 Tax=Roseateles sp. TaxID=1971397 RepID=UPI0039EAEA88